MPVSVLRAQRRAQPPQRANITKHKPREHAPFVNGVRPDLADQALPSQARSIASRVRAALAAGRASYSCTIPVQSAGHSR